MAKMRFKYEYVELLSVHDGDTATFRIQLGLEVVKEPVVIRLYGIQAPELPPDYGPCVFCLGKNLLVAVIRQRIILNPTCPCCGGIGRVRTHNPR